MSTGSDLVRVELGAGRGVHRSPALSALGVAHAFTTRSSWNGGALDLACLRLLGLPAEAPAATLKQVHGGCVRLVSATEPEPGTAGDALVGGAPVGGAPGRALLIRTADCVPVLLSGRDGRRVGAVHAGWRGIVAGVVPAAVAALDASRFVAAVGPCLSTAHFEVGPEVAEQFATAGLGDAVVTSPGARPHIDLRLAVSLQLERAGAQVIDISGRCTWDDPELFSHRRDVTHGGLARTGRLGALIAPRSEL